ncbi:S-adenosyl-L-methionine-dependent methyltransferase [Acinetobacter phage Brutus]|nr:S-adenosyl-L-methionine-dependent methyltransferase [Acinetobacter phage Brutus]
MINLMHGDCLELMKTIPDGSVDLCVSDIPYKLTGGGKGDGLNSKRPKGILKDNNQIVIVPKFEDWLPELYRVMKNGSHIYLMCNFKNLNDLMNKTQKVGFKHVNLLVWEKNNCTPSQFYMKNCEYTLMVRKGSSKYINDIGNSKTVHKFENIIGNKVHPTEKPIDLMEFYIKNSSNESEIVLDMFMGSGSTGVAAKNLNRAFIGIELDENYFNIAKQRIESA